MYIQVHDHFIKVVLIPPIKASFLKDTDIERSEIKYDL